jgi:hypothetical protein
MPQPMTKMLALGLFFAATLSASAQTLTVYYVEDLRVKDGLIEVAAGATTSVTFPAPVSEYHIHVAELVDIASDASKTTLWFDTNGKKGSSGLIVKSGGLNLRFKVTVGTKTNTPVIAVQERSDEAATAPTMPNTAATATANTASPTARPAPALTAATGLTPTAPIANGSTPARNEAPTPFVATDEVLPGVVLTVESRGVEAATLTLVYRLENRSGQRMLIDPDRARFAGFDARIKTLKSQWLLAPGQTQTGVIEVSNPTPGRLNLFWDLIIDLSSRKKATVVKVFDLKQFM